MLTSLAIVLAVSASRGQSALTIIESLTKALEAGNNWEVHARGVFSVSEETYSADVKVTREPCLYWAHIAGEGPTGNQYVSWTGKTMIYTGEDGKRVERDVPQFNVVVNEACYPAYTVWKSFCDLALLKAATAESSFYVQEDEVNGAKCDVVGIVASTVQPEPSASIRYFWVDRNTHLPLASQRHTMIRGYSNLTDKMQFTVVQRDPKWPDGAIREIPEQVEVPKKAPVTPNAGTVAVVLRPGQPCPKVMVETLDNQTVPLPSLLKGKTLIAFWAPWCGPCMAELEALKGMPEVKDGRLKVIAISVFDSQRNAREYAKRASLPFTVVVDPDSEFPKSKLADALGISAIPHAFLFDAKGKFVSQWVGFSDAQELAKHLSGN